MKLLIVDDNMANRKMLCNILQSQYEILEASGGMEALAILHEKAEEIAAVLLDIVMPEMDGFAVLHEIRNTLCLTDMPVIIQTENTDTSFEAEALKAGATDFVSKPYSPEIILARLKNVINTRTMLKEISNLSCDELTGLMSVNQFYYEGDKWIAENEESSFDLVALDIVHFSVINDSKGVEGGNEILRTISQAIKSIQDDTMFLASRVYADRFIMLFRRREGYVDRLIEEADRITALYADSISIHMKFGIYEITESQPKLPLICGRAFSATNLIKDVYGNKYVYYDEKLHQLILMEQKVNDEMENALKEGQFQIYFQPKYELFTGAIAGAEALVRWIHPKDGVVSPGSFISIFEKNGFIVKLDEYVWNQTARLMSEWIKKGNKVVPVSVNISRIDIEKTDVVRVLCGIVDKYGLKPELLHLEITESAYIQDTDQIIEVVQQLKEKGFIIEMDDFGSGYSSLNMLAKLPINILKLDMKFIQELENSANAKTIIEYTIGLAKWMDLPVVAEGVENDAQLEVLRKLECNYVQGYIFSRPLPVDQFEELLCSHEVQKEERENKGDGLFFYNMDKKYKMMIVDDQQLNRSIIRSYFESSFGIIEAVNGKVALGYMEKDKRPDIILLDLYMPELNGFDFLEALKKNPSYAKIPVLVISALTQSDEKELSLSKGADAFVAKPFTAEDIINKVRILLHARSVLDELSIWDLREFVDNVWVKANYDTTSIIDIETGKICTFKGEKLIAGSWDFTKIMTEECYRISLTEDEVTGSEHRIFNGKEYLLDTHVVTFEGKKYLICFKQLLEHAIYIRCEMTPTSISVE